MQVKSLTATPQRAIPKGNRHKVLIVDDDPLMRRVISQSLERADYEMIEAASGAAGIQRALEDNPDIIILDVMLPEMDGFDVIRRLRAHPLLQGIPIIILTALGDMNEKVLGMQLGADDYITKPFDPRELRVRVQAHLKRSEQYLQTSPLTNLPGNHAIQQVIWGRLATNQLLAVIYFDLTNFKTYNDRYGWLAGDELIKELGRIIVAATLNSADANAFIGHIGGDDFVVVTHPQYAEKIARAVIDSFEKVIPSFYNLEDRTRGYVEMVDRRGEIHTVPLVTLGAAIVTNEHRQLNHPLQIAEIAAQVKAYLKTLSRSEVAFDRRRG